MVLWERCYSSSTSWKRVGLWRGRMYLRCDERRKIPEPKWLTALCNLILKGLFISPLCIFNLEVENESSRASGNFKRAAQALNSKSGRYCPCL